LAEWEGFEPYNKTLKALILLVFRSLSAISSAKLVNNSPRNGGQNSTNAKNAQQERSKMVTG
jgi:hypothetical protein